MITTLTYANNFDIMKGMMNIKHIKIKISIWITTTSCGSEKRNRTGEKKAEVYSMEQNIAINLLYYYFVFMYQKELWEEDEKEKTLNFYSFPLSHSSLCGRAKA